VDSNGAEGAEAASESHLVAMVAVKGQIKATKLIHDVNKEIQLQTCPHVYVKGYSRPLPGLEVPAGHLRRRGGAGTSGVAALVNGGRFRSNKRHIAASRCRQGDMAANVSTRPRQRSLTPATWPRSRLGFEGAAGADADFWSLFVSIVAVSGQIKAKRQSNSVSITIGCQTKAWFGLRVLRRPFPCHRAPSLPSFSAVSRTSSTVKGGATTRL
jgi:hypothetical protein